MPVHRTPLALLSLPLETVADARLTPHDLGTLARLLVSTDEDLARYGGEAARMLAHDRQDPFRRLAAGEYDAVRASLWSLTEYGYLRWDGETLQVADDPGLLR